jgi:hypothetical protein
MEDLASRTLAHSTNKFFYVLMALHKFDFFLNWHSGYGVQVGPLDTAATNRPVVPARGDYDDGEFGGMMTGKGNRSTRRKPASVPLCPLQTPHAFPDANPGRRCTKPATNRLSYGTVLWRYLNVTPSLANLFRCRLGRQIAAP